jgi:hypothetical protein
MGDAEQQHMSIIKQIIGCPEMHVRWLNTLSYLENCGARKIAACEHPTKVSKQMLKHAAEEFRHAHHLKQQIQRLGITPCDNYTALLGGYDTLHYLNKLDVAVCRFLKKSYLLSSVKIKEIAYLLVTYAIEVRASGLYPIYQQLLKEAHSKVSVHSIIIEEDHHLEEMTLELSQVPFGHEMAVQACSIEGAIFDKWITALAAAIHS